ncbi:MAG: response regulator [Desulfurivibrionaceae bacterium]
MPRKLRLLIVEDSEDDALLLAMELRDGGYEPDCVRVESQQELDAALESGPWDAIFSDYFLPAFTGLDVLRMIQQRGLDLPIIIVSGVIGEETAVEALHAGAHDYLIKGRFARLAPALERALRDAALHRKQRQTEEELTRYREHLEQLVQQRTEELEAANEELRTQSEELLSANDTLTVQALTLEEERSKTLLKNRDLEAARVQLEKQAHDLGQASRYKSDFLANMSHELRNPLNSLLILSRDLKENRGGNLTHEQVESAELIERSGISLLNLINDILDLAKIEAGGMDLVLEELPLRDMAGFLKTHFARQFRQKGIDLLVEFAEGAPKTIITDQQRLEQILINLLTNALKFTEKGEVELSFASEEEPTALCTSPGTMVIRVRDTGIGIPADKLQEVFDSFRQADSSTSRRYGGTGLGLAIVRNLTRLLGGTIAVESEVGTGSTFILRLPLTPAPAVAGPGEQPPLPPALASAPDNDQAALASGESAGQLLHEHDRTFPFQDKVVFLVDDDMRNLFALAKVLEGRGLTVRKIEDGEKTLALLDEGASPDIILMDIMMPGLTGYETTRAIRERGIEIPVIALTAKAMKEDRDKCLAAGANDYLSKPVDIDRLMAMLKVWLQGRDNPESFS